ncbi:PREDICTED: GDNF family receptor alpha-1-like [Nanorana parkeri]|uniref:GDNF family receptor alpha-1-like n=1 Tax=Nanorana parkeri TaxID=125878 RepID=UPI000854A4FB|nr:PREDICTED: GDNF family receptor alpha-1-like [Nanorana parkeri]
MEAEPKFWLCVFPARIYRHCDLQPINEGAAPSFSRVTMTHVLSRRHSSGVRARDVRSEVSFPESALKCDEESFDLNGIINVFFFFSAEPLISKGNDCLDAAKACNLDDTCKKYRSAYITPCTNSISNEICNRRKCHKALRQFFDKVPAKHCYGMLFCSCKDTACSERRRQTIVPACSYDEREKQNCLNLQESCKTNYICRSRLAHFLNDCQPDPRSASGCLKENYAECLLAYSGLIGTGMTPNYIDSTTLRVSPWCDCLSSGNYMDDCLKFLNFFKDNLCLRNAIQAFGNGTDVKLHPDPPVHSTTSSSSVLSKAKTKDSNYIDTMHNTNEIPTHNGLPGCANLIQAQRMKLNDSVDTQLCLAEQSLSKDNMVGRSSSDPISAGNSSAIKSSLCTALLLLAVTHWLLLACPALTL